ncbi:MAG: SDR family oxidoreductase [Anaerolineae bacterium]|nr:SDR family oxidoreductase [Anaerolineae bacterium]
MAVYLITGGAGFIGSNLAAELISRGERVRVLDNFATGQRPNLAALRDKIEVIEGDIRSYHIVREAVTGVDFVLHQAALPSVPRSVRDPITTNEVNVLGTLNMLQAAKDAGVKRLVYASSSSVYGDNPELPKREIMCPRPLSPYAISKLAGEQYCQTFWRLYGFETVCLRYFNVFGPRQDPTSQYAAVIPRFITALLNQTPLTIFGDGQQSRDFTFIANVVQANLLACTAPAAAGGIFNIACGQRYTLLDLVAKLATVTGREPQLIHEQTRSGDVPHSQADISQAENILNYKPVVDLQDGLERTVDWFRTKRDVPKIS